MALQILPPDPIQTSETFLDLQLVMVITGLAIGVFAVLKITKLLSKIKIDKSAKKPSYTS
ncbi:hypothetical protein FDT66_07250 [Polaribacter aestuariivivens]|uniref:Uncharacterized protein n=1 Tax=Polaribacter aestuariivivens TaxID=2304626 RepID=A0A5S3N6J3_9FLAO|nr:hypothetical protein [Polaribacter aestuariivivens]TMM30552.1 hypothetical protein FDT66_07250 [Polaribacter aestuariivivens]